MSQAPTFRFIVSREQVSGNGAVIVLAGLDYRRFMHAGAPVYWSHSDDHGAPAIARCTRLVRWGDTLLADVCFDAASRSALQRLCLKWMSEGRLNGASLGAIGTSVYRVKGVRVAVKSLLYEISLTDSPANSACVRLV